MDKKEIESIINQGETENIEFKSSLSQTNEIIQTISGFANSKGGIIFVGVSNNGEVFGCDIGKDTIERLTNSINQNIEPKIYPEILIKEVYDKKIIIINTLEIIDKPILAFGKLYKRVGKSTLLASRSEFEKLVLEKHKEKILWENQICKGANLKDIDEKTIKNFFKLTQDSKRLNLEKESTENLIKKLNLSENNELKNSAILLFGKEPKKYFINNIIKCGRFRGEEKEEFIDLRDFNGNLFENLESSINFIKEHLRISAKIEGISRKEQWEIPLEVFREALINAMIHRDYTRSGFIYIKIYDSKIIIANPGELPIQLKINDLYKEHESYPKTPLLAQTFYYTGFIDVWGRGSLNIIKLLKERGLDKPLFEQAGGYFRIIFKRTTPKKTPKKTPQKPTELEQKIINIIKRKITITREEIAKELNMTSDTIKEYLKKLKDKELLVRVGGRKQGYWKIIK